MRSLARSYLCWLNINKDIDYMIANNLVMLLRLSLHLGSGFKAHGLVYISTTLVQWKGIRRYYWLSLTLTLSGLMYIAEVTSTTSYITIEKPRGLFDIHGIPDVVDSDTGTVFTSDKFETFVRHNGIRHVKSALYHLSTNGLAEHAIQTLKESLKKSKAGSPETRISHCLFKY